MIPNAKDTREAIGDYASSVSNRSLLFEKMPLPKSWDHPGGRFDDATRFNVLRAATDGDRFLRMASQESQARINGHNTQDHVRDQHHYRKTIADSLAAVKMEHSETLRAQSTAHLLGLIRQSYPDRSRTFIAALGGRLLINMAGGVQENAGLSLDRCFGQPLIPGSAVKGVARHTALWEIRSEEDSTEKTRLLTLALLVFGYIGDDLKPHPTHTNWHWAAGDMETLRTALSALPSQKDLKGIVSFLQASPADGQVRIVAEGITPHTDQAGQEMSPNPLTFPAVERGSNFGFALVQNRRLEEHALAASALDQAASWLRAAITGTGIGAKTSAGYGWFIIDDAAEEARRIAAEKAEAEAAVREAEAFAEATARAAMTDQERHASDIAVLTNEAFMAKAKDATEGTITGDELSAFFHVLRSDGKKDRRKQWRRRKPDLWEKLISTAATQGIELQ